VQTKYGGYSYRHRNRGACSGSEMSQYNFTELYNSFIHDREWCREPVVNWFDCHKWWALTQSCSLWPPKANWAFHPSVVGKWVPASAGKAKAGMVHSVSGWTRGVQVKLWDALRTRAIPERLRGAFTTRRYTNPRLPLPYLYRLYDINVCISAVCSNRL